MENSYQRNMTSISKSLIIYFDYIFYLSTKKLVAGVNLVMDEQFENLWETVVVVRKTTYFNLKRIKLICNSIGLLFCFTIDL